MTDKNIDFLKEMAEFTFTSKYARYNEKEKRRETWGETVARLEKMHLRKFNWLAKEDLDEIRWAFDQVRAKLVVPSMRSLQFGGKAIEAHEARIFNCLHKDTEFITSHGVKKFSDFQDGDEITVLTHTGSWKRAVVRNYGKDYLYPVTIKRVKNEKTIYATKDHTWILKNGEKTTRLEEGDLIRGAEDIFSAFSYENALPMEKLYWAYGFVFGDGSIVKSGNNLYSMVRLCGEDKRFKSRFEELGFSTSAPLSCGGDFYAYTGAYLKNAPDPQIDSPELIRAFVAGYCDADAAKNHNGIHRNSITLNKYYSIQASDQAHIDFIRKCFPIAGIYIVSETDLTGQVTNFGTRPNTIRFRVFNSPNNQANSNTPFSITKIGEQPIFDEVWCLEVEDDHSFVFPFGAVTGNCSVRHIDSIRSFSESFYLLLCGCGLGIGLSNHFLSRLPDLVDEGDKTGTVVTYVITDTIEGWADSVEALLMCYFKNTAYTGRKIVFDYSKIRKKGAPLKTGGGKAPGYKGLKQTHQRIKELLDYIIEDRDQRRLKTIDAYDIIMHCADAVLSGGIRRSATSVVFMPDDEDMMNAKTFFKVDKARRFAKDEDTGKYHGQVVLKKKVHDVELDEWSYNHLKEKGEVSWIAVEPQRARSNNSVLLFRDKATKEQFQQVIDRARQFGEPGFVFANDERQLFNPCVSGDTMILTDAGEKRIDSLVGTEVNVWNGYEWSSVTPKITGYNQPMLKITLEDGRSLVCTHRHEWLITSKVKVPASVLKVGSIIWQPDRDRVKITSVEDAGTSDTVYCFTEPKRNLGTFNRIVTGQCFEISFVPVTEDGVCGVQFCNLTSQNGHQIDSAEKFRAATKAATIIGTLQAAYTHFPYLSNAAKELTEQEALLGVSITGFMDNPQILLDPALQREMAQLAVQVNKEWAAKLHIKQAARITCVKPEGTSSLVLSAASGIHPHHARRYFRRIQCNKLDNVYKFAKKCNPHATEESIWSATKTDDVLTFPVTVGPHAMVKSDLTAIKHLDIIKSTQQNWVLAGTTEANTKPISHNVSCTVLVGENEWSDVVDYLYDNRQFFSAVALLPASGDKQYKQAPLEAVVTEEDEKKWAELTSKWQRMDFKKLTEEDDETQLQQEVVCGSNGACEVK